MVNLISLTARPVRAKGLNKLAIPREQKVKEYFFSEDYCNLELLQDVSVINYSETASLFYPGCGADILFPLKYIERLFPRLRKISLTFNDVDNNLSMIKTILDDIGISFSEKKNGIDFYWKNILVDLNFITGNVFQLLPKLPKFDIYFERAFRIMKGDHQGYEEMIYTKLNHGGILISDSGFQQLPLQKIKVSQGLSSYREMIIGVKK